MNDATEYRFAASIFRAHLERTYAAEGDSTILELLCAMKEKLALGLENDIAKVYAVSLSPNGNEPGMWRLYASRGRGFNIAFDLRRLLKWSCHRGLETFWRCRYGEEEVSALSRRALAELRQWYVKAKHDEALSARDAAAFFLSQATRPAVAFKPAVWRDEQEWRVLFLQRRLGVPAYFELPLPADPNHPEYPIVGVCAGPESAADDLERVQTVVASVGATHIVQVRAKYDPNSTFDHWRP